MPKNKPNKPKRGAVPLGRALLKGKTKKKVTAAQEASAAQASGLHMVDSADAARTRARALVSVTEVSDLQEFVTTTVLADSEYSATSGLKVVIDGVAQSIERMGEAPPEPVDKKVIESQLRVPRRPDWTYETSPEDLDRQERDSFLQWRRAMAQLEESAGIGFLTPFERNIEVWRQLWRVVERSDVVVQLVDARNPLLFRCPDLDDYVGNHKVPDGEPKKKTLLLLNKSDLLTVVQRREWSKYFRGIGIQFIFYSAVLEDTQRDDEEGAAHLYGPSEILDLFKELGADAVAARPDDKDMRAKIGLVGYPNVGKSSCINSMFGSKKVRAGATPGKTKHLQTLNITSDICLVDCPGLVFPSAVTTKAELVCNGILPIDQLRDHFAPVSLVCEWISLDIIEQRYGIRSGGSNKAIDVLSAYCNEHGMMTTKGVPHWAMGARVILRDFNAGKLLYCHPPSDDLEDLFRSESRSLMAVELRAVEPGKTWTDEMEEQTGRFEAVAMGKWTKESM